jgi:catechol 2,3-dioxygenase-like lactoylglutathione lyase family enzyme
MLDSGDLVAFAPTTDLARAEEFYGDTLGLRVKEDNPIACVFDAHGTALRVTLVDDLTPAPYTIVGWVVSDLPETVRGLAGRGVQFQRYEGFGQDDLGIWTAPSGDRVAWFKDHDGNTLSLTQPQSEAGDRLH